MQKENKQTNVILITYKEDANGRNYKETRNYDGNFAGTQILRTVVGLCNDTIFNRKYNVEETVTKENLEILKEVIEALLQKGEIKNAN